MLLHVYCFELSAPFRQFNHSLQLLSIITIIVLFVMFASTCTSCSLFEPIISTKLIIDIHVLNTAIILIIL